MTIKQKENDKNIFKELLTEKIQDGIYIGSIEDPNILNSFNLKQTFECGQCFRWKPILDETKNLEKHKGTKKSGYIGIVNGRVIEIIEDTKNNILHFYSSLKDREKKLINLKEEISKDNLSDVIKNIQNELIEYLDLNRDYEKIKKQILKHTDKVFLKEMEEAINYGYGIRILNQEIFETILTYIISANNNIPRIKKIVDLLSSNYGKEIIYKGEKYYAFPTKEDLKYVTKEDYRKLGVGFRDIRLKETVDKINENGIEKYIKDKESLKLLSGVGDKVAECIMLFSLKQINTFPIDVWVRRVVNDIYFKNEDEKKVKRKDIEEFGEKFFGGYSGLAQEYLFYWRRDS